MGVVGLAENKANSAPIELELELELSLAKNRVMKHDLNSMKQILFDSCHLSHLTMRIRSIQDIFNVLA